MTLCGESRDHPIPLPTLSMLERIVRDIGIFAAPLAPAKTGLFPGVVGQVGVGSEAGPSVDPEPAQVRESCIAGEGNRLPKAWKIPGSHVPMEPKTVRIINSSTKAIFASFLVRLSGYGSFTGARLFGSTLSVLNCWFKTIET